MSQPSCIILGGPNGSGKSSAYAKLKLEGVWINADEIAKELTGASDGRAAAMAAGRAAIRKLAEMIETRTSFVYETTLSSQQAINLMRDAKAAGFSVGLYYVALDSVETNIERVRQRVEAGGHDIPDDDIRRRYVGSLDKLGAALTHADEALLMDNSGLEPHEVFRISAGEVTAFDIDDENELHKLYVAKVCEALGLVRTYDSFRTPESISYEVNGLTNRILRSMPGHKSEPSGDK
ncbi:zeta toxin family protein [Rhizobium tumorigenes]|uniref:Zeta toxin family protein n=1 Tax=Rhizobium tumorigenes TaxID=2041385 RepID=A0AAF1K807_9HYPH|nr:zeta toxin family protein [Rhizobium tumorigenes]WFR97505.1 zeta toxin family protein [Rhizobium tumorigenes]